MYSRLDWSPLRVSEDERLTRGDLYGPVNRVPLGSQPGSAQLPTTHFSLPEYMSQLDWTPIRGMDVSPLPPIGEAFRYVYWEPIKRKAMESDEDPLLTDVSKTSAEAAGRFLLALGAEATNLMAHGVNKVLTGYKWLRTSTKDLMEKTRPEEGETGLGSSLVGVAGAIPYRAVSGAGALFSGLFKA
ncbi:MAG: hypothetical protein QXQ02_05710, partial [Halobacteria archaeon]